VKDPERRHLTARQLREELEALRRAAISRRPGVRRSIAVLPFADMSPEKDQEYFCEGMAEEITNALGKVENLRVASRTSAFRYKSSGLDAREIGSQLGVNALLEGSVRKAGTQLRISAELTGVADGYCLWSGRYDRELKDVFAIQEEIALSIVRALQVTLSASESRALQTAPTMDIQAYDYYLRGRKFFYQYSKRGMGFALEMFARAIECDPDYALAHAGIADCYSFLYMFVDRSDASRERVDAASRKALELAPGLAQAHASRALALSLQGKHEEAEGEFERAIRLDPGLFDASYFYARDSFAQGKLEKAARLYERAMELRPEDYQSPLLVAQIYSDLGRPADAEATRKRGLGIVEEHLKTRPDDIRALYMGANALVAIGEHERGLEWARRALVLDPDDSILLYNVACIRALAGQADEALDCLERAMKVGMVQKEWIVNDSNLAALRDHPRYRTLVGRME
jgi:adenylate cyclase